LFRNNKFDKLEHVNILLNLGGLGDLVARLPVIKYIQDNVPNIVQHVWVPDYALDLCKNLLPRVIINPFSKGHKKYQHNLPARRAEQPTINTLGSHLTESAFYNILNKPVDNKYKNYLSLDITKININKFNLPKKYVVITTGYTTKVRELLPKYINEISSFVREKGYEIVFLGNEKADVGMQNMSIKGNFDETIDYSVGLNLINKTSILEAGKIINGSKAIVGLDNGLLHLAACTDIPIVGGFTTVHPVLRMPYRHDKLGWNYYPVSLTNEILECNNCQSSWNFVFDHDFATCYYKDNKCCELLSSNKYIEELKKIL